MIQSAPEPGLKQAVMDTVNLFQTIENYFKWNSVSDFTILFYIFILLFLESAYF